MSAILHARLAAPVIALRDAVATIAMQLDEARRQLDTIVARLSDVPAAAAATAPEASPVVQKVRTCRRGGSRTRLADWPTETIEAFKRDWHAGVATTVMGARYGCGQSGASAAARKLDLPARGRGWNKGRLRGRPLGVAPALVTYPPEKTAGDERLSRRADAPVSYIAGERRTAPVQPPKIAATNLPPTPKATGAFEDVESAETVLRWIKQRGFDAKREGAAWFVAGKFLDRAGLLNLANRERVLNGMTPFRYTGPPE